MKGVKGILLMAGRGKRFGDPIPKQYHLLEGRKIYLWTLHQFLESELFEEILLVCHMDWIRQVAEEVSFAPFIRVVEGAATRQESSFRGILACGPETEYVVIHDAVRPFVSQKILKEHIAALKKYSAVDTCIPSQDTLVYAPDRKNIEQIPNRSEFLRGQTPQSFAYPLILEAHQKTHKQSASDDCQLVLDLKTNIHIVEGCESNIKITTSQDMQFLKKIFF